MTNRSRRRFLEDSMFAAAAAATAGTIGTSVGRAAEGSKSPNEKLRVAVVGVNGRGMSHVGGFGGRNDCELAAIVDVDEAVGQRKTEDIKKQGKHNPAFFQDLRKVLDDSSIDIVSIATPNHWHALAAIWAIQAGKDVYVEKPVSHNVSEGRRIVDAARKYDKICQTGTQCRSTGGTQAGIDFVKSGKIGEVKLARGLCYKRRGSIGAAGNYDVPASVDYNLWCGPAPDGPLTRPRFHYDWHWQWDYGNGDLGNQGIHQMDVCRWGLGVDGVGEHVLSYGGRFGYEDAGQTANTQVSYHNYGDKALVFEVRGLNTEDLLGAKVGCIFYGSEGYVVLNSYNGGAAFDLDGNQIEKFSAGGDHFGNFIDAVRSRKYTDLAADIEQGHLSSALCHLGNISYRLGESVPFSEAAKRVDADARVSGDEAAATFDRVTEHLRENDIDLKKTNLKYGAQLTLDGEQFVGEMAAKANPMLTREYREPFNVPEAGKV